MLVVVVVVVFVVLSASEFDAPLLTSRAAPASESSDCLEVGCVDEDDDGAKMSCFNVCMQERTIETYLSMSPAPASASRVNGL